ncbi:MAG: DUF4430 domain-containing protein [Atopobiaceae bacterium]
MSKTGTTGLGRRALAALLTLTLATSGVPASAYAEAASQLGAGESTVTAATPSQQQADDQSSSQGSDSISATESSSSSSVSSTSAATTQSTSGGSGAAAASAVTTSDSSDSSQQAVDIHSAYITTDAAGTHSTYIWSTTDTIWAWAKEDGASTAIDSSLLNYQWQVSDSKRGTFTDIPGATQQSLSLADYAGKYVRCHVSAKYGDSSYDTRARNAVTADSDSVAVQKVTLDATGPVKSGTAIHATATGTDGSDVSSKITWSWYSSSDDSSTGQKIGGATSSSYTPTSDQAGSYVYAVATAGATSTKSTYIKVEKDGDDQGDDTKAGAYDLTSVQVTSSNVDAHAGATLSATARYEYQGTYYSYETDVPDDAQVTYTWHASAADGTGDRTVLTQTRQGSAASTLELTDDLAGCQVWVEASASKTPATSNKMTVGARDTYSLKNVNLSPSTGTVVTGSTVSASVFAYNLSGTGTAVTDQKGVSVQWYVADSADADQDAWTALDGATGSTLQVPAEAAGKYLKAVATSGTSTAEATFDAKVVDANSLDGIVAKLSNEGYSGWKPSPKYGTDTNVNDMLLQHLASLGVSTDDVTVSVKSASFEQTDAKATVGVSTGDSDNGAITYYSADPDAVGAYAYTRLQTIDQLTYVITRDGQSVEYVAKNVRIPWDQQKATELLQQKADQLAIGHADGDSADSLTQNTTLPYKAGNPTSTWTSVSWTSDSDALTVDGYGWDDYTAKVTRGSTDQDVTLTATVKGLSNYGLPDDVSVMKTFKVTVKADPQKVQEASQELQASLDSGYTYDSVSAYQAGDSADHAGVTGDLVMPRPRTLGVDGKYYTVTYTSDNAAVTFNGYHAVVVRPLGSDTTVNVTCTVTSKENPEITASKTLSFVVKSVSEKDIDDELALMQKVEAAYKSALLGQGSDSSQSEPVTQNLSTFQKAYLDSEGNVTFARTKAEADAHTGIALTEVDGYQDMGPYDQARLFQSSDTNVVLNETLQLAWNADRSTSLSQYHAQPKYNTTVKISSKLTSERYGSYYQRYKDDSSVSDSLKGKLAQLAATNVSADVKVAGTSGKDTVQASGTIIGQDANGVARTWATLSATAFEDGTTAEALVKQMLSDAGLTCDASDTSYGWYLSSITKDGETLGYDAQTGKYWQFFVNGKASDVGMSGYTLKAGDVITLAYSAYGSEIPTPVQEVKVSASIVGLNSLGYSEYWGQGSYTHESTDGATAETVVKRLLADAGLTYDASDTSYGWYLSSITKDGKTYAYDSQTGRYWQFFVNGKASDVGMSGYTLQPGDVITLAYSAYGDAVPEPVQVSGSIIGVDSEGKARTWVTMSSTSYNDGATAETVVKQMLSDAGLTYEAAGSGAGWYLNSITKDGQTLGWDPSTGKYWQFFVNGVASNVGMGGYTLQPGDVITLAYSAYGDPVPTINHVDAKTTVRVRNDGGTETVWLSKGATRLEEDTTAADATMAALQAAGLTYDASDTSYGWYLKSITKDGQTLGWDATTNRYWHFYVNGQLSDSMASNVKSSEGDAYEWVYETDDEAKEHEDNGVTVDPNAYAKRPSEWTSEWPTYRGADGTNTTTASTPTTEGGAAWAKQIYARKDQTDMTGVSEPVLVNGQIYIACGSKLEVLDSKGNVRQTANLAQSIDSVSRMAYTDGLLIVPLHDGRLQALTADSLTTVWLTDAISSDDQQSLSSLTVADGYVYFGTSDANKTKGYLRRVNIMDGSISWTFQSDDGGYYWAGGVMTSAGYLVCRNNGELDLMSSSGTDAQGQVLASLQLGSKVASGVTLSSDGSVAYVSGYDGALYKVGVNGTNLTWLGSVQLPGCVYSASTPTLSNGLLYVGGADSSYNGVLCVVDADTLEVRYRVNTVTDSKGTQSFSGAVMSSPLVATHDGQTYVYFTANSDNPGGVLMYKLGDQSASWLYYPQGDQQQYNMSSAVAGSDGSLYFINDSGYLFKANGTGAPGAHDPKDNNNHSAGDGKKGSEPQAKPGSGDEQKSNNQQTDARKKGNAGTKGSHDKSGSSSNSGSKTTLRSVVNASTQLGTGATSDAFWLLGGVDSDTLGAGSLTGSSSKGEPTASTDDQLGGSDDAEAAQRTLPIWPIIGMAAGAIALVWALLRRRNDQDESEAR